MSSFRYTLLFFYKESALIYKEMIVLTNVRYQSFKVKNYKKKHPEIFRDAQSFFCYSSLT